MSDKSDKNKPEDESGSSSEGEEEYEVEKIVGRRPSKVEKGKFEYQLKWKGYDEPTWEPEDALSCPELLQVFKDALEKKKEKEKEKEKEGKEKENEKKETTTGKGKRPSTGKSPEAKTGKKVKQEEVSLPKVGFEYGHKVEDIIGARMDKDELMLFVSWKDEEEQTFVPARIANEKIPQLVIAFYESRLRFEDIGKRK